MIERLQQKRKSEGGFTLVELLVVIVILGILAAIVVFAVGGITDKGDASAKAADRSVLETAEEAYFANDKTPPSLYGTEQDLVDGKYLRALSTKHDICLSNGTDSDPGAPVVTITPFTQYEVVDAGDGCAPGYSLTGA